MSYADSHLFSARRHWPGSCAGAVLRGISAEVGDRDQFQQPECSRVCAAGSCEQHLSHCPGMPAQRRQACSDQDGFGHDRVRRRNASPHHQGPRGWVETGTARSKWHWNRGHAGARPPGQWQALDPVQNGSRHGGQRRSPGLCFGWMAFPLQPRGVCPATSIHPRKC